MSEAVFDKYERMGAYHWRECDRGSKVYNPPLAARYGMVTRRVGAGRALDLGAGDGYLSGKLAETCAEVVAIEYEPSGVALASKMLADRPNVTVRQGSTYELPFEGRSFDAVVMADVIEHLDNPEQAVREMSRVVAADGEVLVSTPQYRPDRVWDERHVKEYTAEEFSALMGVGFEEVKLVFAWPRAWSDFYRTKVGWRLLRLAGRMGFNPFAIESDSANGFCQMLAVCRKPRSLPA